VFAESFLHLECDVVQRKCFKIYTVVTYAVYFDFSSFIRESVIQSRDTESWSFRLEGDCVAPVGAEKPGGSRSEQSADERLSVSYPRPTDSVP